MRSDLNTVHRSITDLDGYTNQADQLAELLPVGIVILDDSLNCTYVNGRWCELGGIGAAESMGDGWLSSIHWDDVEGLKQDLLDSAEAGAGFTIELKISSASARVIWAQMEGRAKFGIDGKFEGYVATVTDISNQMQAKAALADLANIDPLTRLPNRNCFRQRLTAALNDGQPAQEVAVLFLDLDDFKLVNDNFGHEYGDELLRIVARRLGHALRAGDFVARLGGDEFVVLIQGATQREGLISVGQKLIASLSQPYHIADECLTVGVSIGIASALSNAASPESLLAAADKAMYESKRGGKNRWYYEQLGEREANPPTMKEQLAQAIDNQELRLAFQPEFNANSGRICGCEALLRWQCPERGEVPPETFLPLIDDGERMRDLAGWVVSSACATLSEWRDQGLVKEQFVMAVNLSPELVTSSEFARYLVSCVKTAGISTRQICVEITEAAMIRDASACLESLAYFKSNGVQITLDDFGKGFAALNHLRHFPLDNVKIDRASIGALADSAEHLDVLKCIIGLADRLDLRVVAKGIDTPEALEILQQLDCAALQGFELSRPLSFEQMEVLLHRCVLRAAS